MKHDSAPPKAMDFRDWCENECARLIGIKDTSFLEFCSRQPRSEAEMLLIENLGSYDPAHEFIDKFLNYMELLPSDVLEISFQSQNRQKIARIGAGDMNSGFVDFQDVDHSVGPEGSSKGGGKKKGKKGKKISSAVLGFNVNDEATLLESEKKAEKMIVEAYSALLLAFLSTESKSIREAIADNLPDRKLAILVPVLDRFVNLIIRFEAI